MTNTPKNSSAPSDARRRAEEALASSLVTLSNEPRYADLFDEVSNLREVIRALLAEQEGDNRWRSRALDAEMALRVLLHQHRTGKPPDVERFADLAGRSNELLRDAPPPAPDEVARLTAILNECNAVCLCGCPESEHESYGEDGEACGHDDHVCIRVPRSVLAYVQTLREALTAAEARAATASPSASDGGGGERG